jgi:glycosyltransferase involved in cell wall biosynthesis
LAAIAASDEHRSEGTPPRVSVVIPAYNAARWIGRTLASVERQTVAAIEIIVVDDGSTDATPELLADAAARDPRIRVLRQPNGGVAGARNAGIAAARAPFVAPIDADDLWHPTRLERHLEAFTRGGPELGLVYSPWLRIDENDRLLNGQKVVPLEGRVFEPHLCENFIGNGSGLTVRTEVARAVGGYSPSLREAEGEGCEDWLFQLKVAYGHEFACVPLYLIGYRMSEGNMSSDYLRMTRSWTLAMREIERFAAGVARPVFWWPRAHACGHHAFFLARRLRFGAALALLLREAMRNPVLPLYLPVMVTNRLWGRVKTQVSAVLPRRAAAPNPRFDEIDPTPVCQDGSPLWATAWMRLYGWLAARRAAAPRWLPSGAAPPPVQRSFGAVK